MSNEFEVKVKNVGVGKKERKTYSVVEKESGNFAGDSKRNYIFDLNNEGLEKAKSVAKQLNEGKGKIVI